MKADGRDYNTRAQVPATQGGVRPMAPLKDLLNGEYVKKRFNEVMGEKAPAFLASVLNVSRTNKSLAECESQSILAAAMVAATLDLPIDPNLGFAAIVPYRNKGKMVAQFQIMTKGFVQLALRSGQYKNMNVGPVYEDEFESYDIISGDVHIHPVDGGFRDQDQPEKIVGYVAFFRLMNGFERIEFWSMKKIIAHGKRFSKSYNNDNSLWKTDLPAMAAKTVLKNTISKWGILSTTMQMAMKTDQAAITDYDGKTLDDANIEYVDTEQGHLESGNSPSDGPAEASPVAEHAEGPKNSVAPTPASKAQAQRSAVTPAKAPQAASAAKEPSDDGLFESSMDPPGQDDIF